MVLSHAVAVGIALYGGVQRFRVTSRKPGRRRTGGGTENNLDSCFLCLIQETVKDKPERKQTGLKILFLDTLSDNDLLKEVHECKRQYKEAKIIIFDGQAEEAEKILTITQSNDIISKTLEKGDWKDESEN